MTGEDIIEALNRNIESRRRENNKSSRYAISSSSI